MVEANLNAGSKYLKTPALDSVLLAARWMNASDVHLKVGSRPMVRVHGTPQPLKTKDLTEPDLVNYKNEILSEHLQKVYFDNKDVDLSLDFESVDKDDPKIKHLYRHRVNVSTDKLGPFVTIRLIPEEILPVEEIGFPFDTE